jgi:hypothetical protein
MSARRSSRENRGLGRRPGSWRWAPVPIALACSFFIQACWGGTSAEAARVPAHKTPRGPTTGFYQTNIQGGTSADDCAPSTPPTATPDTSLDSVFANQTGPGWLGGDIAYSAALPRGQESFVFGDTLLGTANPSGAVSLTGFAHGSEMVGNISSLNLDVTGTPSSPRPLIPDNAPNSWQAGAIYVEYGQQLMFVNEFSPVQGSLFENFIGTSGIAVFSLSSGVPVFSSITPLPTDPVTQWGVAMTQSGGYDYVYGEAFNTATNTWYGMKVARVPLGSSLDTSQWTYWNGSGWLPGEGNAVAEPTPFITGIVPLLNGSGFMGVGNSGTPGQAMQVAVTFACSPIGPWSTPQNIYTIPEISEYPHEFAYMATFHPEISDRGELVTSYSVNSLDGLSALKLNDHQYQPHFIQIAAGTTVGTRARPQRAPAPLHVHATWHRCRPNQLCS